MVKAYRPIKVKSKGFVFAELDSKHEHLRDLTGLCKTASEASETYRKWCIEYNNSLTHSGLHVDNFPGVIEFEVYH